MQDRSVSYPYRATPHSRRHHVRSPASSRSYHFCATVQQYQRYICAKKNYIRMFLGKKINEQCISIFSNLIPKLTWACFVVFIVSHLWFFLCVCTQFGHAKIGPCGGNGGKAHDIMVLPHRLENVTICSDIVIHSLAFSYSDHDGQHHTAGPWGGDGGNNQTVCVYCKLFHCQFV